MPAYPTATSKAITQVMKGNVRRDTKPELALRKELHRRGLRFRVDYRIDYDGGRVRPDIVFTRAKVAVFVDGCFWHGCQLHGNVPKGPNEGYWTAKLVRNQTRDARNDQRLRANGWTVIRIWEHEEAKSTANAIEETVKRHLSGS